MTGNRKTFTVRIIRASSQAAFLLFFAFMLFKSAYPPMRTLPTNIFLRADPAAAVLSTLNLKVARAAYFFLPAWVLLALTAFGGRFFCAYICPLGTCFDMVKAVRPSRFEKSRKRARIRTCLTGAVSPGPGFFRLRYALLAALLLLWAFGLNIMHFSSPLYIMNRSAYQVLLPSFPFFFALLLILSFALGPRVWCETVCPTGALLSVFAFARKKMRILPSPLAIRKNADRCIGCAACYAACDFGVPEPFSMKESGRVLSEDCTGCGECVRACPASGALVFELFRMKIPSGHEKTRPSPLTGTEEMLPTRSLLIESAFVEKEPHEVTRSNVRSGRKPKPTKDGSARQVAISRRDFIASAATLVILGAGYSLGAVKGMPYPLLRMPGAQDESRFVKLCNRCGQCTRACPTGCIRLMGLEGGLQKLWTPRFLPREACCIFDQCGHACAIACPAKAIELRKADEVIIGYASVNWITCLGFRGQVCLVCKERCRFNAIQADGLRPSVVADLCTGCGACEQTCPTEPASIKVFPAGSEPRFNGRPRGRRSLRGRG